MSGTTGRFGGISATEGMTWPDIDTGALNLDTDEVFELTFPVPIVNQQGEASTLLTVGSALTGWAFR